MINIKIKSAEKYNALDKKEQSDLVNSLAELLGMTPQGAFQVISRNRKNVAYLEVLSRLLGCSLSDMYEIEGLEDCKITPVREAKIIQTTKNKPPRAWLKQK